MATWTQNPAKYSHPLCILNYKENENKATADGGCLRACCGPQPSSELLSTEGSREESTWALGECPSPTPELGHIEGASCSRAPTSSAAESSQHACLTELLGTPLVSYKRPTLEQYPPHTRFAGPSPRMRLAAPGKPYDSQPHGARQCAKHQAGNPAPQEQRI